MATAQPKRCLRRWTTVVNGHTISPRRCDRARLALKPATCAIQGGHMSVRLSTAVLRLFMGFALFASFPLHAEVGEIRIAHQPGLSYLPLMLIERHGLLQKHGRALGLPDLAYKSVLVGSAAALNDVLLSNSADIIAGAITVMAALSDRARHLDIRGIAALNCDAFYLNTNKLYIKTLRDFGSSDRIAVSAVKLSIHAIVLQMAAEKEFGPGRYTELDALTVSMPHPEAMCAIPMIASS